MICTFSGADIDCYQLKGGMLRVKISIICSFNDFVKTDKVKSYST